MIARISLRGAAVAATFWLASPAGAQTRFLWPAAKIDVSRYATVEECLAATARVRDSMDLPRRMRLITEPMGAADLEGLSPPVVEVAQRCSAKWPAATASLDDYAPLLPLYLQAGRDADARTLVQRRLAAPDAADPTTRATLLNIAAQTYVFATPSRIVDAETTLQQLRKVITTSDQVFQAMSAWYALHTSSVLVGDTARARRAAEELPKLAATLTPQDKESLLWQLRGRTWTYKAYEYLSWFKALDRLRESTAAYTAIMRSNWSKASEEHMSALQFPIGTKAAPLTADFWFMPGATAPSPAPSPTRPTTGSIALVIFLDGCMRANSTCWDMDATIKRLHAKYPDLELTVIGQTLGYVLDNLTQAPSMEADVYRQWWLGYKELPAAVAISSTPFTRLEDPDRRRMNQATPNQKNYSVGHWPSTMKGYLIDRDGTIIYADTVQRSSESHFTQLIDILEAKHHGQHADRPVPVATPPVTAYQREDIVASR